MADEVTITAPTPSADVVNQFVDSVNRIASKDDRWLFIALLVIGLVFVWILFKYFTTEIKRLRDRMDVMQDRQASQQEEQTKVIANNTVALQSCQDLIREFLQDKKR